MMLIGTDFVDLDLLSIIIAYLFFACGQLAAGAFAFGQGLVVDLLSGGLDGISTATYLAVFGAVYMGRRFFDLEGPKGQFIIVSLAVLLKKSLFLGLLSLFSGHVVIPKGHALVMLSSAGITGLVTPIAFFFFGRLNAVLSRETPRGAAGAL